MIRTVNGVTYNPPAIYGTNSTVTGTTSETILNSVVVPANTFKQYDIVGVQTRITKTTTSGTVVLRLRIGTTLNTSQTQAGTFTSASSTHTFIPFDRRLSIQNTTTTTRVLDATANFTSDFGGAFTTTMSTLAINWTVNNFIILTAQPGSSSDVVNCGFIYLDLIEPRV